MIGAFLSGTEARLASVLRLLSATLLRLAERLEETPLTSLCHRTLSLTFDLPVIPTAFTLSLVFVFSLPILFRFIYGDVPILSTVPAPSLDLDLDEDPHIDQFSDTDVKPQLVSSTHEPSLSCVDPSTGKVFAHVPAHVASDVSKLVSAARAAQTKWATSSFARRRRVLATLSQYILYEQKGLCAISGRDTGKTGLEANLGEIIPTLDKLRWLRAEGEQALRASRRSVGPMTMHKVAEVQYMPLGVIGAIAPWNYPLHNIVNPVSAALFAGCGIVVKPSEHAVYSSVHFVRVIRRALAVCGENPELVQIVVGGAEVAAGLVTSGVDKVFFTGSTEIGKKVAMAAARTLVPTCLELGGKDAMVICEDADVDHAVSICLRGVFQNAGQNCIGIERVVVHEKVVDDFVTKVVEVVKRMRVGVDVGAMTMGTHAIDNLQRLVDDAVSHGAHLRVGGRRVGEDGEGCYYFPTVLTGCTKDMRIAHDEVFGPVLSVFVFGEEREVIELVNECRFGLGASVFSKDVKRAERLVKEMKVGMGNVNDFATNYLCQSMPFGGTRDSGSDRFAGIEGLRGCCLMKSTTRDRVSGLKTSVPKVIQYPVAANAEEFACELNDLMFGSGWLGKMDNLRHILGMVMFPKWRPRSVGSG